MSRPQDVSLTVMVALVIVALQCILGWLAHS